MVLDQPKRTILLGNGRVGGGGVGVWWFVILHITDLGIEYIKHYLNSVLPVPKTSSLNPHILCHVRLGLTLVGCVEHVQLN